MANAFQDQLLKAGLVSKDKVNKANKSKHKQARQQSKNQTTDAQQRKLDIKQAAKLKMEHDRELNRQKVETANTKAIGAQIRQLIEMNRIALDDGETVYNFEHDKVIKRIYVTDKIRLQIINGQLAIVWLDHKYEVIPQRVAKKIQQRDASFIILCNEAVQESVEDDEYADYKVPDDLMW